MVVKILACKETKKTDTYTRFWVKFEYQGKVYDTVTFSKKIADSVGQEIDVESQVKEFNGKRLSSIKPVKKFGNYVRKDEKPGIALQCASRIVSAQILKGKQFDGGELVRMADDMLAWLNSK
jgi:hypothetical protein